MWVISACPLLEGLSSFRVSFIGGFHCSVVHYYVGLKFYFTFLCLAILSFFIGLFGVLANDWPAIAKDGFFQGYTPIVGVVITLQVTHM